LRNAACAAVAYSGGRDSTALLHATLSAATAQGLQVIALHVHHGLSVHADAWLAHCERQCRRWAARGLPLGFAFRRLEVRPAPGDSVEAWARRARYTALREMALGHAATLVLLAHHRQDQAETLLLQALRGAGVAGLAAMPQAVERDGIRWARPWLTKSPDSIASYVRKYRLKYIEDDSNADRRYARNLLRQDVWPALSTAFPQAEVALDASARWANEAAQCADALAAIDLAQITDGVRGLDLAAWMQLSPARRSNALRAWLKAQTSAAASAPVVERLLAELPQRAPAQWPLGRFTLYRYRGRLACRTDAPAVATPLPAKAATLCVTRAGIFPLNGWNGRLRVRHVDEGGVPWACLANLRLAERGGGEQFQAAPDRPPRSLKKQFQAKGVPAWGRVGPLVCCGDQLLYVPGLGIDARAVANAGSRQASLEWLSDSG
jgi:tRNA(Ile)-lysidine synthase